MLEGTFESTEYDPGYCHGKVSVELDEPLTPQLSTTNGTVHFTHRGEYKHGETQSLPVSLTKRGEDFTLQLRPTGILTMLMELIGIISLHDVQVDWLARTVRAAYSTSLPRDAGTISLRF